MSSSASLNCAPYYSLLSSTWPSRGHPRSPTSTAALRYGGYDPHRVQRPHRWLYMRLHAASWPQQQVSAYGVHLEDVSALPHLWRITRTLCPYCCPNITPHTSTGGGHLGGTYTGQGSQGGQPSQCSSCHHGKSGKQQQHGSNTEGPRPLVPFSDPWAGTMQYWPHSYGAPGQHQRPPPAAFATLSQQRSVPQQQYFYSGPPPSPCGLSVSPGFGYGASHLLPMTHMHHHHNSPPHGHRCTGDLGYDIARQQL
jgi:hypothetical protein